MSSISPPTLGFIGLGVMGRPMALNLLKAGYPVIVFNRRPEKTAELVRLGARAAPSPAEIARTADIIFLCLPDTPDVEVVLFGAQGIIHGVRAGSVVVDCSTIAAGATRDFAARLKALGVDLVDCPVSGGAKGAEAGTLAGMLGGETAAVERVLPVLQAVGKKFVHAGPPGSGQVVKACNQLVIAATLLGVSEAVALCRNFGLDPETMRAALLGGSADSFVLQNHAKRLITGTLAAGFRARLMLKDLRLAAAIAEETGTFSPVGVLAVRQFTRLCESNRGDLDSAAVGLVVQENRDIPA
jgi:2-hydroxy-3-oxopropionate reductase